MTQLTGFLCLAIRSSEQDYERRVALALPLEGTPPDRNAAVVRSILADSPGSCATYSSCWRAMAQM